MESFWRSWGNSLSDSLLYYCIFHSATRGTSYFGLKAELPLNCRDSRIISMINFDLNLIMNAFFGNKAKDIVVIHPLKSKVLQVPVKNGVNYKSLKSMRLHSVVSSC